MVLSENPRRRPDSEREKTNEKFSLRKNQVNVIIIWQKRDPPAGNESDGLSCTTTSNNAGEIEGAVDDQPSCGILMCRLSELDSVNCVIQIRGPRRYFSDTPRESARLASGERGRDTGT